MIKSLWALLPFLFLLMAPACGQEKNGQEKGLGGRVSRIAAQVAEIRSLPFEKLPKTEIRTRSEIRPLLEESLRKVWGLERLARLVEVERRLGMFAAESSGDPVEYWLDASAMGAAGFYDYGTDAVLLVEEALDDDLVTDALIAHELTHALQARHRNLASFLDFTNCTNDAAAWRLALVEGEATIVQFEYLRRALGKLISGSPGDEDGEPRQDALPAELKDRATVLEFLAGSAEHPHSLMNFAYFEGARLLDAVQAEGGWDAVDSLFAGGDLTTEIVLHPEKLKDPVDHPTNIVFDELGDLLTGWNCILADTLGEAEIRAIFEATLPEATAATASIGWDGDRLLAYAEVGGERTGLVWALVFDSELDAMQFKEAWIQLGEHRSGLLGAATISGRNLCVVCGFTEEIREKVLARAGTFTTQRHEDDDLVAAEATSRAAEEKAVAKALERRGDRVDGVLTLKSAVTGMRLSVPADWDRHGTDLEPTLFHRNSGAKLSLYFAAEEAEKEFTRKFHEELASAGKVREREGARIDLAGRKGSWRAYEVMGEGGALRIRVRLYACPADDGTRLLALIYPFEAEQEALEAVRPILESLEVIKR